MLKDGASLAEPLPWSGAVKKKSEPVPSAAPRAPLNRVPLRRQLWEWKITQKYANSLLVKLLRTLLGHKAGIS